MTQLIDKFNCIDMNKRDDKTILENLENYFENYFQNNNKVLLYDYMLQAINFNSDIIYSENLSKIIYNQMGEYISFVRNNMRASIKKNLFNLDSGLNKFFIDFKSKIDFINSFLNYRLNNEKLNDLLDIIINDIYIKTFIEININCNDDIINIYITLKKYNLALQTKFIQILGAIHKKDLITKSEYPIPDNLKRLYDFNKTLIKVKDILKQYVKLAPSHYFIITKYLYEAIIIDFKNIILKNNLNELNIFIKNNYENLWPILNYHGLQTNSIILNIKADILHVLSKDETINDLQNNKIDIMDIIYIIDFSKQIVDYRKNTQLIFYKSLIIKIANIPNISNNIFDLLELHLRNYNDNEDFKVCRIITEILINYNKDETIKIYYKNLLKRLLNNYNNLSFKEFNKYISCEKTLYYIIKNEPTVEPAITYPIIKLINNFSESIKVKQKMIKNSLYPINAPLISNNSEINIKEGTISADTIKAQKTILASVLNKINTQYIELELVNRNKSISWLAHFGEITICYLNHDIKLLPIQMLILELFNENDYIDEMVLLTSPYLKNYSSDFKSKLLESFVKGKLLFKLNNTYVLNNMANFSNDLITIFHSLSNMNQKWEDHTKQELIHAHHDIMIANINSLLKTNKYNYHDISKKLKDQIKLFVVDDKIIDESLKIMLDKDYIVFNTDSSLFEKLYY